MFLISDPILPCFSLLLEILKGKATCCQRKVSKIKGIFLSVRQPQKKDLSVIGGSEIFGGTLNPKNSCKTHAHSVS